MGEEAECLSSWLSSAASAFARHCWLGCQVGAPRHPSAPASASECRWLGGC